MTDNLACNCGIDHAGSDYAALVLSMVEELGPTIRISELEGQRRCWEVPRVFIAFHGLKASELPALADRYGWKQLETAR